MLHWLQENPETHGLYGVEIPKDWSFVVTTVTEITFEQKNDHVAERPGESKAGEVRRN